MLFVLAGSHIKVVGRAVHSLSKIGDELYIEPLDNGLSFRTLNSSRSAFACFVFSHDIFETYDATSNNPDNGLPKVKVSMKSCLNVFKSVSALEKLTETCSIGVNSDFTKLIFHLQQKSGIKKSFYIPFIESETMQAVFSREDTSNFISVDAKLLTETLHNFLPNQEEITLEVTSDKATLKNNVDDEPEPSKIIHTELTLEEDEFGTFNIGSDSSVTFCLKELRAFLTFADCNEIDIQIHFDSGGQPIVFSIDLPEVFTTDLVLATLANDEQPKLAVKKNTRKKKGKTNVKKKNPVTNQLLNKVANDSNKRHEEELFPVTSSPTIAENAAREENGIRFPGFTTAAITTNNHGDANENTAEQDEEVTATSPPNKKCKSFFEESPPTRDNSQVIVHETDEED